jgi:excisionase family DNA binding protein
MKDEKLLTTKEAAEILRVSERSLMRYIKSCRLKASKIGWWRIRENDLNDFIDENLNKPQPKKKSKQNKK